jgi:hypothetical protein
MLLTPNQRQEVLADPRFSDIGALPSQFFPYQPPFLNQGSFSRLYVRPFAITELKLLSKAVALEDSTHLIRAVDLVTTENIYDLTIGDFYYVMAWLRIHSMPKTPMVANWHCKASYLRHKESHSIIFNDHTFRRPDDLSAYEVVPCDTYNTEILHMVNMDIISFDDDWTCPFDPTRFDFPRVKHMVSLIEALKNPELRFLAPIAQWLKPQNPANDTLDERFKALEATTDLSLFEEARLIENSVKHGVNESTTLNCRLCRAKYPHKLNIQPLDFFR